MTDALATFMLARIAEDERAARAVTSTPWRLGPAGDLVYRTWDEDYDFPLRTLDEDDASHIGRWDPVRVLAECEAKRRIVKSYEQAVDSAHEYPNAVNIASRLSWQLALAYLAQAHSKHPDYCSNWVP